MKEVLDHYWPSIQQSDILSRLKLKPRNYFVFSAHREENVDSEANFSDLLDTLQATVETFGKQVIVSTHPRTRKRLEARGVQHLDERIRFLKPLGFFGLCQIAVRSILRGLR